MAASQLYATTLHKAVERGDLDEMRRLVIQAEEELKETGNIPEALERLKAEVDRLERDL